MNGLTLEENSGIMKEQASETGSLSNLPILLWAAHCVNSSCHGLFPEVVTTEEKVNVTCVHTSAADNGTSYLLELLPQLSFRESFCLLLVPRPHRTVMTCKCWGREV